MDACDRAAPSGLGKIISILKQLQIAGTICIPLGRGPGEEFTSLMSIRDPERSPQDLPEAPHPEA